MSSSNNSIRSQIGLARLGVSEMNKMLHGPIATQREEAVQIGNELQAAYRSVFNSPAGKTVLNDLMHRAYMAQVPFKNLDAGQANIQLHIAEGKKELFRTIVAMATPETTNEGTSNER